MKHKPIYCGLVVLLVIIGLIADGNLRKETLVHAGNDVSGKLWINADQAGIEIGRHLYGVFFEDINHGADGGLYGEMVQNRSFEFNRADGPDKHGLSAWQLIKRKGGQGSAKIENKEPLNPNNLNYLTLQVEAGGGGVGIMNTGYNTGFNITKGQNYKLSLFAGSSPNQEMPLVVSLENLAGDIFASAELTVASSQWTEYSAILTACESTTSARLVLLTPKEGTLNLDMVSLFPENTYNQRANGLREDIAQMIAQLQPGFFRFPGGCIVHAGSYQEGKSYRVYRWKDTLGDVAQRPVSASMWAGNNQSFGLGFYELFLFAEDIGATPIPHVTAGVDPHDVPGERGGWYAVPLNQMQPWIDNALDLIEFATGDMTTVWGAKRAEMGHPDPFNLEYIGIGNEDINFEYAQRFEMFQTAIKEKYPDIKVISSSGPFSQGREFDYGWEFSRKLGADLVDEHFYNDPNWFFANWNRYDDYPRQGPKVFIGEYGSKGNTLLNALAEAAFMIGLERNADVVKLAAYAPLLANADYLNWTPDLIWYNNHQVYGTVNYYVQQMFALNKGDRVIDSNFTGTIIEQPDPQPITGGIGLGTWATQAKFSEVQVTDNGTGAQLFFDDFTQGDQKWHQLRGSWAAKGGAYYQTSGDIDLRSYAGEDRWANYTITLKAAKLGGAEGFLVMFGRQDEQDYYWWNIGGWNNTQHALEKAIHGFRNPVVSAQAAPIVTGREYDIKIIVEGRRIRCYLDGKLIHDFYDGPEDLDPLYSIVTQDAGTGDLILKAVNAHNSPLCVEIEVSGDIQVGSWGEELVLTGDNLDAANSFSNPEQVVPKTRTITGLGPTFVHTFPAYSLTILRLKTE